MKHASITVAAILCLTAAAPPLFATTATSLGSFEGREEPTAIRQSSGSCKSDSYTNITNPSSGLFRMTLRYSSSWWDDDGGGCKGDRQRAEVKGLGAHQKMNETYEYTTTWRTNRGGSGRFWDWFQLKATNGTTGMPVAVGAINSGTSAAVRYCAGSDSCSTQTARSFGFSLNTFTAVKIRIRTSTSSSGEVRVSVSGDSLSGKTGIPVYKSSSTDYRPKWGSYRKVDASYGSGDYVEHKDVTANKR